MAWPAAQTEAIKPPASSHQFMMTPPWSYRASLLSDVAQTQADGPAPLGGILEFDKSGMGPAAAMRLDRGFRKSVVAQPHEGARAVRLDQEFHGRLPWLETFHATPAERHLPVWNDFQVSPFDRETGRVGDEEHTARPGIGLDCFGEPDLHLGRIGQESKHGFGRRIDADIKSNLPTLPRVAHFFALLRSTASAAFFNRRSRGPQCTSMNSTSSSKASARTT